MGRANDNRRWTTGVCSWARRRGCGLAAHGERAEGERIRRIGVLTGRSECFDCSDVIATFRQGLQQFGRTDVSNARIDTRWAAGNLVDERKYAAELVALTPDVILSVGGPSVLSLLQVTRTVPIVFTLVADPIGSGFVDSLSRPGGNVTGFMQFEYSCAENGWNCSRRSRRG